MDLLAALRLMVLLMLAVHTSPPRARAENWPAWRGPDGTGKSSEKGLPIHWSTTKNVRWRVALPEPGNSTPIVWGNRIFVTQAIEKEARRTLMCFDRADGRLLWQSGTKYTGKEPSHRANPSCSPSPVTDGERVIVWYGSAGLYCYDFQGNELWSRDLGPQRHMWGIGSSPVLHENLCLLNFGPGEREFVVALDKRTGNEVWRVEQLPLDEERKLSGPENDGNVDPERDGKTLDTMLRGSWATPILVDAGRRKELVVPLPRRVSAFDPATGRRLWTCGGLGPLTYGSPAWGDGVVVVMGGYFSASLAVKPGGSGDVTHTHRVWHRPRSDANWLGTGIIDNGRWYVSNMSGIVDCKELFSGKTVWRKRLTGSSARGNAWGSITMSGDGVLYLLNQSGDTFVFQAEPEFHLLATNALGEATNSSIVPSDGELFIRTHKSLWCIHDKK